MEGHPIMSSHSNQSEGEDLIESTLSSYQDLLKGAKDEVKGLIHFESIDHKSYSINEVPQTHLLDPEGVLPLNSDLLVTTEMEFSVTKLSKEDLIQIKKQQTIIDSWEKTIAKNNFHIESNNDLIKQNKAIISNDKKNRDYWTCRAEEVILDFENTRASGRESDWTWFIKKYGMKHPDGNSIEATDVSVDELVDGGAVNLSAQYRGSATRYEINRKNKEMENNRYISENSKLMKTNEVLKNYIHSTTEQKIKPLQAGLLMFKALREKLEELKRQEKPTYGALRDWAEDFLNSYLKEHPSVPQYMVTDFRKIASIPLPAENS